MKLKPHEIHAALGTLITLIERCGASSELTGAVTLTSDLRQAVGNRWNPADDYAAKRVLEAVGPVDPESEDVASQGTTPGILRADRAPGIVRKNDGIQPPGAGD